LPATGRRLDLQSRLDRVQHADEEIKDFGVIVDEENPLDRPSQAIEQRCEIRA